MRPSILEMGGSIGIFCFKIILQVPWWKWMKGELVSQLISQKVNYTSLMEIVYLIGSKIILFYFQISQSLKEGIVDQEEYCSALDNPDLIVRNGTSRWFTIFHSFFIQFSFVFHSFFIHFSLTHKYYTSHVMSISFLIRYLPSDTVVNFAHQS